VRRTSSLRIVRLVAAFAWPLLIVGSAAAKREGQNKPCDVCHEGRDPPKVSLAFDSLTLQPGQVAPSVQPGQTINVAVTATHPSAAVGGVFVDSHGSGEFRLIDAATTRLMEVGQATHSQPHPYLNGQVQFSFTWVAPSEVGVTRFDIWSNAANNNLMQADDSPQHVVTFLAHGCEGTWYYPDGDGDGYGNQSLGELSCTPIPALLTQGGDCDDTTVMISPAVAEVCNNVDDNCDGAVDEGFMPVRHYVDADADTFGALGGMTKIGCSPLAGYAPRTGDCDDMRPEINPFAMEVPNGIDDNCNSQTDEKETAPVGTMPGPNPSPGSGGPGSAGTNSGGCSTSAGTTGRSVGTLAGLGALWAGVFGRRRYRSRRLA